VISDTFFSENGAPNGCFHGELMINQCILGVYLQTSPCVLLFVDSCVDSLDWFKGKIYPDPPHDLHGKNHGFLLRFSRKPIQ
jgi:hypothetical protein